MPRVEVGSRSTTRLLLSAGSAPQQPPVGSPVLPTRPRMCPLIETKSGESRLKAMYLGTQAERTAFDRDWTLFPGYV